MSHWWTSVMLGEQWMAWRPSTSIQRPGTIPNQLRTQAPNYGYSLQHSAVDRRFGNAAYNHSPSLWWLHAIGAWSLKMMPSSYSRTQTNMAGRDEWWSRMTRMMLGRCWRISKRLMQIYVIGSIPFTQAAMHVFYASYLFKFKSATRLCPTI